MTKDISEVKKLSRIEIARPLASCALEATTNRQNKYMYGSMPVASTI